MHFRNSALEAGNLLVQQPFLHYFCKKKKEREMSLNPSMLCLLCLKAVISFTLLKGLRLPQMKKKSENNEK